ncbi:cleavage stimulation factor subunit 2 isoform X2 [Chrysoperla carnea]|uniref:cleavage stimulation factor subunit 2 isoform X2 n=1 Tax=Chrysoperla carnea TaxID=189513 RepID=UPI001D06625E|nr:cleavage stimulation factor subunit 2 isoform X2 [Chrysoperla carnea]
MESNMDQNIMDKSMRSVFVGNIPYEATEEKLKDIFSEVGPVLSFKLVFDRETGKPKGYGFCEYKDQETALSAMRNLNNYEIAGRTLRVDNACTEKSRMEMQNLLQAPTVENPYGEPIQAEKAPEAISKAVASLPPEQMFELMKQMKLCIQNNPTEARTMLLQNPQLAYALLQAQVVMRIIDPAIACTMLHKANQPPPTLQPAEKVANEPVPINLPTAVAPVAVPAPRQQPDFPSMAVAPHSNQNPVFSAQDVDLRSIEPRPIDPRLSRMGDQDMRIAPTVTQPITPVPPPITGSGFSPVDTFSRDPRAASTFTSDPRQRNIDPRHAKTIGAAPNTSAAGYAPTPVAAPIRPPPNIPILAAGSQLPRMPVGLSPNIGPSGASDQEKAALIMQVLQLSDDQIAMLPPEQRTSILVLKEQIAKSTQR